MSGSPHATTVLIAAGEVPARAALDAAWPGWAAGLAAVVAADGGAAAAQRLGLRPDLLVGDFDSLTPGDRAALEASGIPGEAWPAAKDASDLELALRAALRWDPPRLVLLGVIGGPRLDHELANLALLALPELAGREVCCLDAHQRVSLLAGPATTDLVGAAGDLVTLLPWAVGAAGVRTSGLAYPLDDEDLALGSSRGLSNVRTAERATVSLRSGRLLIVETHPAQGDSA